LLGRFRPSSPPTRQYRRCPARLSFVNQVIDLAVQAALQCTLVLWHDLTFAYHVPFLLGLRSLLTFQQPGLLASGVKIDLPLCVPQSTVENNADAHFLSRQICQVPYNRRGHAAPAYIAEGDCHEDPDYRTGRDRDAATSAVAKTQRTKAHIQPNTSVSHNSASQNSGTQLHHNCRFEHGESDPDSRIRLQLVRDCKSYEEELE